jgi:hypothetical protein
MVTFLVLFIVYCVMYYDNQKKINAPLPEWAGQVTTASTTLTAAQVLNDLIVATTAIQTLTFPTAAAIVTYVNTFKAPKVDQTFRLIIVNRAGATVTIAAGTGVTLDANTTLTTANFAIYSVTLTNVGGGSEAVSVARVATGAA